MSKVLCEEWKWKGVFRHNKTFNTAYLSVI